MEPVDDGLAREDGEMATRRLSRPVRKNSLDIFQREMYIFAVQ